MKFLLITLVFAALWGSADALGVRGGVTLRTASAATEIPTNTQFKNALNKGKTEGPDTKYCGAHCAPWTNPHLARTGCKPSGVEQKDQGSKQNNNNNHFRYCAGACQKKDCKGDVTVPAAKEESTAAPAPPAAAKELDLHRPSSKKKEKEAAAGKAVPESTTAAAPPSQAAVGSAKSSGDASPSQAAASPSSVVVLHKDEPPAPEGGKKGLLDCAFIGPAGTKFTKNANDDKSKSGTYTVDVELAGKTPFTIMNIHTNGDGPNTKGKLTIKTFLEKEGMTEDKLADVSVIAGDSNITPFKCGDTCKKDLKGVSSLSATSDLSGAIAAALREITGKDWSVYMANTKVGKRRVGWSLMNTQVFKSSPETGGAEFDGTMVAVKNEAKSTLNFGMDGTNFRSSGCDKAEKTTTVKTLAQDLKAFEFAHPLPTTGDVFLDHAMLVFKAHGTEFAVINMGAVVDVKYKGWGEGETTITKLGGINVVKDIDDKLFKAQMEELKKLKAVTDCNDMPSLTGASSSDKFWGMGSNCNDAGCGMKVSLAKSASYLCTEQDYLKATATALWDGLQAYLKDAPDAVKTLNTDCTTKVERKDWGQKEGVYQSKLIWKATGEYLTQINVNQPFGGFGYDIAANKLPTDVLQVDNIYNRVRGWARKNVVVVASEASGKHFNEMPSYKEIRKGGHVAEMVKATEAGNQADKLAAAVQLGTGEKVAKAATEAPKPPISQKKSDDEVEVKKQPSQNQASAGDPCCKISKAHWACAKKAGTDSCANLNTNWNGPKWADMLAIASNNAVTKAQKQGDPKKALQWLLKNKCFSNDSEKNYGNVCP